MSEIPGYPIVLTADRTLLSKYDLLFDGMLAASQTTTTPKIIMDGLLLPRLPVTQARAGLAPLGLRRIEAALRQGGFSAEEVIITPGELLAQVVGPATRIIAISSGDPLGRGMNSNTMTAVAGGMGYPEAMFRRLLRQVRQVKTRQAPAAHVLVGGAGAWQLVEDVPAGKALGIDHVMTGYVEGNVAEIFRALTRGETLPELIIGQGVPAAQIPRIVGPAIMGGVELSRGCGLGCAFCTIAELPMQHLPAETILADAATNIQAGAVNLSLLSEDFFRYGADGARVNPQALISLLTQLRRLPGLRLLQIDHANVSSIARFSDAELQAVHELLVGENRHDYLWVNVGVETASGALLKANGCAPKMGPAGADAWGELCAEQLRRLCRAGFFPLASLMVGLPGERDEDLRRTLEWVLDMRRERLAIFPMFLAPLGTQSGTALPARDEFTRLQWQLIRASYASNFKWVPYMYRDNQRAAGTAPVKRLLLQALGCGKTLQWLTYFAWHAWRAPR